MADLMGCIALMPTDMDLTGAGRIFAVNGTASMIVILRVRAPCYP